MYHIPVLPVFLPDGTKYSMNFFYKQTWKLINILTCSAAEHKYEHALYVIYRFCTETQKHKKTGLGSNQSLQHEYIYYTTDFALNMPF